MPLLEHGANQPPAVDTLKQAYISPLLGVKWKCRLIIFVWAFFVFQRSQTWRILTTMKSLVDLAFALGDLVTFTCYLLTFETMFAYSTGKFCGFYFFLPLCIFGAQTLRSNCQALHHKLLNQLIYLVFLILLPRPPEYWDYRCTPQLLASSFVDLVAS